MFQSPRSGKFVSDTSTADGHTLCGYIRFQSPRSGKFVSDKDKVFSISAILLRFNPLDRGNLYQIGITDNVIRGKVEDCFNPLDRGNLYQI